MTATTTCVGQFRCASAGERWWWSDQMFLIHGMRPGDVVPTRELLLAHVHHDDRQVVADVLDQSVAGSDTRGCEYSLLDLSGKAHRVVLAAAGGAGDDVTGFLVDVTAARDTLLAERVNADLALALESHAAIDQAKGILMLIYGVDDEAAFRLLKQSSQKRNVRLRSLAGRVIDAAAAGLESTARERLDEALSTVFAEDPPAPQARRSPILELRTEREGDTSILRALGRVDLSNRDDLASAITLALLRASAGGTVTVDLRGVVRIGSAAADVLTTALRQSAAHGITMTIVGGGPGADEPLAHPFPHSPATPTD
ncbi:ANTAR domain-containing protein [Cellulomonas humilata]|uniref:ANTAR domain-containing protein n=1 Tax=Cellulomonas humilata TaxID=144055 RepID=A0A7Y6E055_9CELL|nr:ANTAR domain-containing protein [Cellulomonas humilata]NUU19719.1 ANTAR domain-containing protein [Cellulomonas humilata]